MTSEERSEMVKEIVASLSSVERFSKQDVFNKYPLHPGAIGSILTDALDVLRRDHGIEFAPVVGFPDHLQRATYEQARRRAAGKYRGAVRKMARGVDTARVATALAPQEEKERMAKTADLKALQLAAARVRSRKRLGAE